MARKNEHSAIGKWRLITKSSLKMGSNGYENEASNQALAIWVQEMVMHLAMGRKIKIDDVRREYFTLQLIADDYHPDQAQRAQEWIMKGDWKFKGIDPTLELADFYPTPEQYEQTLRKTNDRVDGNRYEPKEDIKPQKAFMTEKQKDEWAIYILLNKPHWGIFNGIPWFERNRAVAEVLRADPTYVCPMPSKYD